MSQSKKLANINDIQAFQRANCRIKNPKLIVEKLNSFMDGGLNRLQVVSDFDYTITKQHVNHGKKVLTSFGIFNACKSLPKHYLEASIELYHTYRPLEISPKLDMEEKIKYMIEWWSKSGDLLMGFPLDTKEIDDVASNYKDCLRDHSHELFETLNRLNVPVLVFSAGLGNSVASVLKQANVMYSNMKIVSNFLVYKDGLLNGLTKPMIHAFNKNETAIEGTEYYDLVHSRDHIIVMGDSLGDAGMANGMPSSSITIKIGFLYDHVDENLERYMDAFDIVLIDDQTMDIPLAIIKLMEDK